jgi:hypothetical protein
MATEQESLKLLMASGLVARLGSAQPEPTIEQRVHLSRT